MFSPKVMTLRGFHCIKNPVQQNGKVVLPDVAK